MGQGGSVPRVGGDQVRSFRLARHNLHRRRSLSELVDVAGACAVQNSPPGSAAVALHARVADLTLQAFDQAVEDDKTLLQTWCMRGSPFFFPAADTAVFTTGLLPRTEQDTVAFVFGVEPALKKLDMSLTEAVQRTEEKLPGVLTGRELAINELGKELEEELAEVDYNGRALWILDADRDALESPATVRGVRLLPTGDPYTQQRDRETILADTSLHRRTWRSVGAPGAVLLDGRIVGAWNVRKQGAQLNVTVSAFESLGAKDREAIEQEARAVAPLRKASRATVSFD
ncbi:DNA glycosylase AlkZ-like family protein [Streptomonospora salina]|uniref:Winged helix DNA-binding domain-containing protein n=1 Tax=Streptomonospora salina TaxID=104205 RepID=A0A841E7C3_9ACTN|nr:crosslink repair DNA glycosylase YcaQ family protein [Streptomonospora salina]MBB5996460.1 hypothetical protein [Streptomonospora salina]